MRLRPRLSLTARLTLLFAAGASAVLLALGGLIASAIDHHFKEQDRGTLQGELLLLRHEIERVSTPQQLERLPQQFSHALLGHQDLPIRMEDPAGTLVLASPQVVFPPAWLAQAPASPETTPLFEWSQGSHRYRGLATRMATRLPGAPALQVAVAVDIEHHDSFMATFRQTLWLFVLAGAAVTGLLGWLVASRGLAPLRAMRERAARVTAQQLDQRLPVESVPSELAELAGSLNAMLARLQQAFERLNDFASDIAHELRTPVSNLMTQTQVALAQPRSAAEYRAILESNAEEFERMARMLADMLLLARSDHGLMQPDCAALTLADEVRALFDFYEAVAEEKRLSLQLSGQGTAWADRLLLRRALGNLLSNAIRHASVGSAIEVSLQADGPWVRIGIRNQGEVIAPEHLARIFDRFFRADPARQHLSEGAGLGLAISQSIIQAHGGTITVASQDQLTTFTVSLPAPA